MFVAGRDLVGVRHPAILVVPRDAGITHRHAAREPLREQLAIHRRPIHQERIGRELTVAWTQVWSGDREGLVARRAERAGIETANQFEVSFVEEPAVSGACSPLAVAQVVGQADARLEVVIVGRILFHQRVVRFGQRNALEVVAETKAEREVLRQPPLVLRERREVVGLLVDEQRTSDTDREPIGIRRRVGGIERSVARPNANVPFRLSCVVFEAPEYWSCAPTLMSWSP